MAKKAKAEEKRIKYRSVKANGYHAIAVKVRYRRANTLFIYNGTGIKCKRENIRLI
jgi:hypothetical protein